MPTMYKRSPSRTKFIFGSGRRLSCFFNVLSKLKILKSFLREWSVLRHYILLLILVG